MFGHDNDEGQYNDQVHVDPVIATPSIPVTDDSIGLGDESTTTLPTPPPATNGFSIETVAPVASAVTPTPPATPIATNTNDLLAIKQEALQHLSPLLGHLEQSPEEKFRTAMMMIQASDDQGLLKEAYETAKQIPDEKVRAQALLDIVNEINYFTQQHTTSTPPTPAS